MKSERNNLLAVIKNLIKRFGLRPSSVILYSGPMRPTAR